ncbi:MAG TPA: hypothetical protein VL624_15915 [Caldimonas sp.]|jgi:hypothetical protein|nr:hypothetical protein [Caldimonas sp.]
MASEPARHLLGGLAASLALTIAGAPAIAQEKAPRASFSCVVNGKKIVSDRLIPECNNTEQRELNSDGSLKRIVKPPMTPDEREEAEKRELEDKGKIAALNDAVRRDRNLMQRYPDEASHDKAREKALDEFRVSEKNSSTRIAALLDEKKKLDEEKKFYVNEKVRKPLPTLLKQKIDANDAALEAQRSIAQNAQTELNRITRNFDLERERLRKLWGGARAGSLGPLPDTRAPVAPEALTGAAKTPSS